MKKTTTTVIAMLAALGLASSALATMDIQKEYKAKDAKAKCSTCHKEAMPKKGAADVNDFGKKVQAAKGKDGKIDWAKVPAAETK
jgi:galactitol-specific phosphotransferase system IIB component